MSVIRKCNECNKDINIILDKIDNVIYFDRKCYHFDCFVKMCERKSANKRCSKKWSEALMNLDKIKKTSKEFFLDAIYKDLIYEFMLKNYNVKVIPNVVFQKLDAFYSGEFKGLSQPMKPEDLYFMWTKKIKYLNKIAVRNRQLGKKNEGVSRIKYDLSVLLNKYDDYLKWKEQQKENKKIEKQLKDDIAKENKINKAMLDIKQASGNDMEEDMDDLLDEIFG